MTVFSTIRRNPQILGFDNLFEKFDQLLSFPDVKYPPYNIIRDGKIYIIEIATAGFDKSELEVYIKDDILVIKGDHKDDRWIIEKDYGEKPTTSETFEKWVADKFVHRGLAKRSFKREFSIANSIEVTGIEYKNGILSVKLIPIEKPDNTKKFEIK